MSGDNDSVRTPSEKAPVCDLHAHPGLKVSLWRGRFDSRHLAGAAWNPFSMRVDLPKIRMGGVKLVVAATYLPERNLLAQCRLLRILKKVAPKRIRRLFKGEPLKRTLELISLMEGEIERTNASVQDKVLVIRVPL